MLFHEYFDDWVHLYKVGAVRQVTLSKYFAHSKSLKSIAPTLTVENLNRKTYQQIISKYAENHAKQTVMDFNNNLKACVLDAVDDGLLEINPCRKVSIGGNQQIKRKEKFLNMHEVEKLLNVLDLEIPVRRGKREHHSGEKEIFNYDWLIYLAAKTGLRFAEIMALTRNDFDFDNMTLSVTKTLDYKISNEVEKRTKTRSSTRTIAISRDIAEKFRELLTGYGENELIFVINGQRVFNSTVNSRLAVLCRKAEITPISVHGLRHTHASVLLYNGVSLHSISKRLGHSKVSVTQDVYSHIIDELQQKDDALIRSVL